MKEKENKIKVATKKLMAYPKKNGCEDEYELYSCRHCGEEYLTQGNNDSEQLFCPKHNEYQICVWCDATGVEKDMKFYDDEWYCEECYCPKCIQCDEPLDEEENSQFCSKHCYNEYWDDLMEDEFKERR
jgi:hypothetical protein